MEDGKWKCFLSSRLQMSIQVFLWFIFTFGNFNCVSVIISCLYMATLATAFINSLRSLNFWETVNKALRNIWLNLYWNFSNFIWTIIVCVSHKKHSKNNNYNKYWKTNWTLKKILLTYIFLFTTFWGHVERLGFQYATIYMMMKK